MFTLRVHCVFCIVSGGAWLGCRCGFAMINLGNQAPGKGGGGSAWGWFAGRSFGAGNRRKAA